MKSLVLALVCVASLLSALAYHQNSIINALDAKLASLQLHIKPDQVRAAAYAPASEKSATLDLQAKCAEQAKKAFERTGLGEKDLAGYQNHYSNKFNRCFVEIESTAPLGANFVTTKTLLDAFEEKVYGLYMWKSDNVKKYWEVSPMACHVISVAGEKVLCHSDDEFEQLAKAYLDAA